MSLSCDLTTRRRRRYSECTGPEVGLSFSVCREEGFCGWGQTLREVGKASRALASLFHPLYPNTLIALVKKKKKKNFCENIFIF
jgi:hypothetical protein